MGIIIIINIIIITYEPSWALARVGGVGGGISGCFPKSPSDIGPH